MTNLCFNTKDYGNGECQWQLCIEKMSHHLLFVNSALSAAGLQYNAEDY